MKAFTKFTFGWQLLLMPIMYVIAVLKILVVIPMAIIGLCNLIIEDKLN